LPADVLYVATHADNDAEQNTSDLVQYIVYEVGASMANLGCDTSGHNVPRLNTTNMTSSAAFDDIYFDVSINTSLTERLQPTNDQLRSMPLASASYPTPSSPVDAFLIKSWACPSWSRFKAWPPQSTYVESSSRAPKISPDPAWTRAQLLCIAHVSERRRVVELSIVADEVA
jgi:hypothetical protein